ncbi:unnamed protein product [Adineta ricciae]|uniref:non-specific serine/threonine protein kinase n=1 Tax=Adineta ricciae TaxID=249248 RepID=A0A813RV35_ADIRI|nr:unnamed protein product [Adineta ricciae]
MATNASASQQVPKRTVKDFKFVKELNNGSYSTVYLGIEIATDRKLAIKAVKKSLIKRLNKVQEVFREKAILTQLDDCAYTISLYCTFQTEENLYFGLTYCSNSDLLQHITEADHFDLETVRFYSAELVEALEQLHIRHVIHRDLKPENILLTDNMHIQLADFGSAVLIETNEPAQTGEQKEKKSTERRNSFVGTPQFVAPEILQHGLIHIGSDFWSLGCVIYQMVTGEHLFRGHHEYDIMNAVVRVAYKLPDNFPEIVEDLIRKLVRLDPHERLGSDETGGVERLKVHAFFADTKWGELLNQQSPLAVKSKLDSRPKNSDDDTTTQYTED